jgi:predicted amidophosphoribosyltransferase
LRPNFPFPHFYLWNWEKNVEPALLVRSLKQGFPAFALEPWLADWVRRAQMERDKLRPPTSIFVPAPPRRPGIKDHAFLMASLLATRTGIPLMPLLRREDPQTRQKFQNRLQRQELKMRSLLQFESRRTLRDMDVHFVDDVVTTGSTARAAYRALGRPPRFFVWSLIYRSRLLPEDQIDILRQ